MERRNFLRNTGLMLGSLPLMAHARAPEPATSTPEAVPLDPEDWSSVRAQFALTDARIHMATFLLASHPRPVAEAIEAHRRAFDANPAEYWEEHFRTAEPAVRQAAGRYLGAEPDHIALTDSTTMGLGLVYGALKLAPDQEILTTTHDHYVTIKSLALRAERTGAKVREVALYDEGAQADVDEIIARMRRHINVRTRVLAVTWVHSSTGVKLPLAAMSKALAEINADREPDRRVLFCVDGVHGLGIEDVTMDDLGCDFFIAGTHKWLFGPRGTGLIWGRPQAWDALEPIIPSFGPSVGVWLGMLPPDSPLVTPGTYHTPGGFHSFEHRWALDRAFEFHLAIGKPRIQRRIHALNTRAKRGLDDMAHVRLHTPMSEELSSGIICFEVDGHEPPAVVEKLGEQGIIASASPYPVSYARIAPSLINTEREVDRTLEVIGSLATSNS